MARSAFKMKGWSPFTKVSPAKQKDRLDVIQQGQRIASDQIDLDEKRDKASTRIKKQDHKNRINLFTGTTT